MSDKPLEQKEELLELLKRIWLPVAGFIGAITLAYNFYQLWLGDQATITYFFGGGGLLVLTIALVWVGFKVNHIPSKIFLPDNTPAINRVPAYAPIYQRVARIFLLIVLFGGLVSMGILFQHRQALERKLVVVIATFEGPEDVYGLRNEIVEKLNTDFSNNTNVEIFKINNIVSPDQGSSYARSWGKRYMADLVIWGWYRPTQNPNITIHIENLNPNDITPLKPTTTLQPTITLADLESFSFQQQSGQETSALISFLAGFIQLKSSKYAQALVCFDSALSKISGDAILLKNQGDIYYYRGITSFFLGQHDQAVADFSKAIQIEPQNATAYYNRGVTYFEQKKYDQANTDFSNFIQIDPKNAIAYNNRGATYLVQQQYAQAIADFSKAIQIEPQDAINYNNRGLAYLGQRQYDKAIADFSKAIQVNPQYALAYKNRGLAYLEQRQYDQAIADFSKAIQINPQYASVYKERGVAYRELGKVTDAEADFAKYKELSQQEQP